MRTVGIGLEGEFERRTESKPGLAYRRAMKCGARLYLGRSSGVPSSHAVGARSSLTSPTLGSRRGNPAYASLRSSSEKGKP